MNKLSTILIAAVSLTAIAQAETQLDEFDVHCADLGSLEMKPVQKEIGLSEGQRTQMNVYAEDYSKKTKAIREKYAGAKLPPDKILYDYYIDLKTKVMKELSPAQVRRLREISLQRIGLLALCDPTVGKRVGLSDAQVKRLKDVYGEGFKQFKAVQDAASRKVLAPYSARKKPSTQAEWDALDKELTPKIQAAKEAIAPQLAEIKETYDKKMRAILTAKQWATYEDLRGKPFK